MSRIWCGFSTARIWQLPRQLSKTASASETDVFFVRCSARSQRRSSMRRSRRSSARCLRTPLVLTWKLSLKMTRRCWRKACARSARARRRISSARCRSIGKRSRRGRRKDRRRQTAAQAAASAAALVQAAASAAETTAAALAAKDRAAAGNARKRNCLPRATASWGAAFRAVRRRRCGRLHRSLVRSCWRVCCSASRSASSRAEIISSPC